jgi:hypothetical protein
MAPPGLLTDVRYTPSRRPSVYSGAMLASGMTKCTKLSYPKHTELFLPRRTAVQ